MPTDLFYPTRKDVLVIHEDIIAEDPAAEPGVRSPDAVDSALTYVSEGYYGERPETIHEKAAHLLRLLVAEHPFVDGNKRTALNTTVVFYEINGVSFDYEDESVRDVLKQFAIDADAVEMDRVVAYCREHAYS
jgi:death-on-curing protein